MKCPTCPDSTLVMTDRQGVEIDYCPTCRGIWLDRGELDKLPDFEDSDYRGGQRYHRDRKKSWLNEIFD